MTYDLTPDKPTDGEPTKEEPGQGPLVPQASLPEGVLLTAQDIVQNDWADIALLGAKSSDYNPLVSIDAYLHKTWRPAARVGMYVYVGNTSDKDLYASLKNAVDEAEKERQREQAREAAITERAEERLQLMTHDLPGGFYAPADMMRLRALLRDQERATLDGNQSGAHYLQTQIYDLLQHMRMKAAQQQNPDPVRVKIAQDTDVKIWKEPFNI